MRVSDWAEKHRVLTMSAIPGTWHNRITPYLTGIMDAFIFSSVQTVIVCKAPQVGGSECAHNFVGYAIDRRPGPVLYIYPDEFTAKENSKDRIIPMIESSPRLRTYMTGSDDDATSVKIKLAHMPIYLAWARSASRLANKPIRYLVFDETDKYPALANKKEADPISLGEKRAITYRNSRKIWKLSTPTTETGYIWTAMTTEAQVVFKYHVVCPLCGHEQLMVFENIKWPQDVRDPERVENENMAWYECAGCRERWNDELRNRAVRSGRWRDEKMDMPLEKYLVTFQPSKIGFHIPSWLSYFVSLSEVAAAFLKGLKDKTKLKDFQNNHKAEPWIDYRVERREDVIAKLKDERPRGLVPGGGRIVGMTAAVDTQDDGFYYEIRAWGRGAEEESWQIREGFLPFYKNPDFAPIEKVLWEDEYSDAEKNRCIVHLSVIDAMGHHTAEVYDWCRRHRGRVFPLKGEQRMNQPIMWSNIEFYPGTNKPIPGGLRLLRVNTTFFKNKLANKLEIAPADPGAWHYHVETTDEWLRQMTSEYVDDNGFWQCPPGKANHAWDLGVYGLAAAEVAAFRFKITSKNARPTRRIISRGIDE